MSRLGLILLALTLASWQFPTVLAKADYEARKQERLTKNREIRRANEVRFEACARACMEGCRARADF